jgi:hypothetical protein
MAKDERIAEPWGQQLAHRTGAAVKWAREAKSARWLSEETARSQEISPTFPAKLVSRHRGGVLNMTEVLVLATALNMPPVLLPFPGYTEGNIKFLPGRVGPCKQVVDWFSGRGRLPLQPGDENEVWPWNLGIELVQAVERHSEAGRNTLAAQALSEDAARINERRRELGEEN